MNQEQKTGVNRLSGIRAIVLDIEGTTSSISFVHDVMFPYAKQHARAFLDSSHSDPQCQAACEQIANDAGHPSVEAWQGSGLEDPSCRSGVVEHVHHLIDQDVKATGLKQLQGLVWEAGFKSGQMRAHVYGDVPPALLAWQQAGCRLYIYSSGSVNAQKLFFGHTIAGDLLGHFSGHWDTKVGGKREAASYRQIAKQIETNEQIPAESILFISDVPAELDAASQAGMQTLLSVRPGNQPVSEDCRHAPVDSFEGLRFP